MQYYKDKATDKEYLVVGSEDRCIRIWDAQTGDKVAEISQHKMRIKGIEIITSTPRLVSFKKPIDVLVSVSSDGVMKCWDLQKAIETKGDDIKPLGEYDAKCRVTCCAVTLGYKITKPSEGDATA
jgi:protein MAK11